ncbi:MAG: VWA domain-containing protein [Verrucomicrobiota bacterium]
MNFLAPAAFAFAAAIPVVILFYLLKRKRVVRLVSSTLLWQKFLAESQASAPFQRLRNNWLLILQIILLVLAVLALSRPYFAGKTAEGRLLVAILDASASMQSIDETPTRFDKARAEALALVSSLKESDQMVVVQAGANTIVKQSATSEKAALRRTIESTAPTDSPTRLAEALKLAETLINNRTHAEIHLFSDGAVPDLAELETKNLPVVYHRIGQRGNNLGVVAMDVRGNPENPSQRAVFTSVANLSTNEQQTEIQLRFNGQLLEVRSLNLPPRETSPLVFLAAQNDKGVFSVHLTKQDDLLADNSASVVSLLPAPVKILLVSRGNRFLEKALRTAPLVELTTAADLTDEGKGYDIVVLDDITPTVWPAVNTMAIHTANTNWFNGWSNLENPAIVDWKANHPLLRFITLDTVGVLETLAVELPRWAVPVVESPQTPLIVTGDIGRQRIVWIGFDVLQSTWPLRVSFPMFMANAVDWLNPASINAGLLSIKTGDPFRYALTEPPANPQLIGPDGKANPLPAEPDAKELVVGDTSKQGVYRLRNGTNEVTFCVNLMNSAESDTAPKTELQFGKYAAVQATTMRQANLEIWRWIAAAALAMLMFEWWFYHRRTA